jgi:muramoyltetrapeptide carboxypeptidase LdcA involved in peptidoglycan recycling
MTDFLYLIFKLMDKQAITKRFLEALDKVMLMEGVTKAKIAEAIGSTPQKLSNISVKDKNDKKEDGKKPTTNNVPVEIVGSLCETYKIISAEYILTGRGSVLSLEDVEANVLSNELEKCRKELDEVYAQLGRLNMKLKHYEEMEASLRVG